MAEVGIEFEWTRAYPKAAAQSGYEFLDGLIRQVGRAKETYRPQEIRELYVHFSELDGSPESCVDFANRYGLLEKAASLTSPPAEPLELWRREIKRMLVSIRSLPQAIKFANSRGTFAVVGTVNVLLVPSRDAVDAKPTLIMEPGSLLQAMNLQLAQFVAGGGSVFACDQCGKLFERGGTAKRRSDMRFCSDRCRVQHHRRAGK